MEAQINFFQFDVDLQFFITPVASLADNSLSFSSKRSFTSIKVFSGFWQFFIKSFRQEFEEIRSAFTENGSPRKMPQKFFGTPRRESKISAPDVSPFDDILSVDDSDNGDAFSASHAENFFSNDFQDSDGEHDDAELSKAAIVEDDDVDYKRYSMTLLVVPC